MKDLYLLAWGYSWPGYGGQDLRTQGLIQELARGFDLTLVVLSARPPSAAQRDEYRRRSRRLIEIPLYGRRPAEKVAVAATAAHRRIPFHCAQVWMSLRNAPIYEELRCTKLPVYCSLSHWAAIMDGVQGMPNWIVDQHNADIQFWDVYRKEATGACTKLAAEGNWRLARAYFPQLYRRAGRVISVCEEDRGYTLEECPQSRVDVVPNGIDCSVFRRSTFTRPPGHRILFTGTSTDRNMRALVFFLTNVLPAVRSAIRDIEFLIAGDFTPEAQRILMKLGRIEFTGRIEDMKPHYERSDVVISPYPEAYGSKLKVAQALAMSMCVVATPAGIRGFDLKDGETVLVGRDAAELARKLVIALLDPELRERVARAGRLYAEDRLDWGVLGLRLRHIVAEVCREAESDRPDRSVEFKL